MGATGYFYLFIFLLDKKEYFGRKFPWMTSEYVVLRNIFIEIFPSVRGLS